MLSCLTKSGPLIILLFKKWAWKWKKSHLSSPGTCIGTERKRWWCGGEFLSFKLPIRSDHLALSQPLRGIYRGWEKVRLSLRSMYICCQGINDSQAWGLLNLCVCSDVPYLITALDGIFLLLWDSQSVKISAGNRRSIDLAGDAKHQLTSAAAARIHPIAAPRPVSKSRSLSLGHCLIEQEFPYWLSASSLTLIRPRPCLL